MKRPLFPVLFLVTACALVLPLLAETEPPAPPEGGNPAGIVPSEARSLALSAARNFTKQEFHLREGEWSPSLAKGTPAFLKVTLFTGVEYGFAAASSLAGGKISLSLFDANGKAVKAGSVDAGGPDRSAVRIAPGKSGAYFVKLELVEAPSDAPAETSLVYAYK
jgi:hypothetical protein